ncbi:hypothetical protein K458DRAFT_416427 [Lentithecium fluviatile CBS 122367]|uniref:Osmotin, thaumatin-like protein n=1 Tax=Lentithecium fluviatile CBS 122367 TaxID=1168545 RepID=A0A6G1J6E1_9PLEO|nr:hypothetical protein K458DRAFT_416427 [Lentithecium fluviatile CBS 122367]
MFSRTFLSAVALQTLFSSALAGQAIINNHCGYEVTVLSTSTNNQAPIAAGATFTEPLNGHASLKIAHDPSGLWAHGITQFEYSVAETLWYDISLIDCVNGQDASGCPGHEGGITLTASGGDCATASCAPGAYCPEQAYFVWNDDLATKSCKPGQNSGDITMTLCSGGGGKQKRGIAGRIEY